MEPLHGGDEVAKPPAELTRIPGDLLARAVRDVLLFYFIFKLEIGGDLYVTRKY
jgi:hypothetical protein